MRLFLDSLDDYWATFTRRGVQNNAEYRMERVEWSAAGKPTEIEITVKTDVAE